MDVFLPLESEFDMQNFHKNDLVGEKAILMKKNVHFLHKSVRTKAYSELK